MKDAKVQTRNAITEDRQAPSQGGSAMTANCSFRDISGRMLIVLLVALAGPLTASAQDFEQYRPQVEQLLADEAVVDIELGQKWRTEEPTEQRPWPDPDVVYLNVGPRADYREGYFVVDETTQQVVGFVGPEPKGPVPMEVMVAEQAIPIAKEFCRRHLAELFAEGGEVAVAADEEVSRYGARMVHLQRVVQGVNMLTLADVGVRVYDGKVVWFRRKHVPLDEGLQLPGEVTLEQARETAAANMPFDNFEPLVWFDEVHEVVSTDEGQHNVWTLWAEIKTRGAKNNRLEYLNRWQIDANTGEVISSEHFKPDRELTLRYMGAGGTHVPPNGPPALPQILADSHPTWSADGAKLFFLSDRQRPGYPNWLQAPPGLFMVGAEGSDLRCLVAEVARSPKLSPDAERILLRERDGLRILSLTGKEELMVPEPQGRGYLYADWLDNETLVADSGSAFGGGELVTIDLTQPKPVPQPSGLTRGTGENFVAFIPMPDGTLYYTFYGHGGGNEWMLMKVNLSTDEPAPEVICDDLKEGRAAQPVGEAKVLLWDDRPSKREAAMWMVDLMTGEVEQWQAPRIPMPGTDGKWLLKPDDVSFSPDGERIAFAAEIRDPAREKDSARLVFICNLDGSDLKQVTAWENPVVPLASD